LPYLSTMIAFGFLKQKGNFEGCKNEITDQEKDNIICCSSPVFQNNKKGIRAKCKYFYYHHEQVKLYKCIWLAYSIQISKHHACAEREEYKGLVEKAWQF